MHVHKLIFCIVKTATNLLQSEKYRFIQILKTINKKRPQYDKIYVYWY